MQDTTKLEAALEEALERQKKYEDMLDTAYDTIEQLNKIAKGLGDKHDEYVNWSRAYKLQAKEKCFQLAQTNVILQRQLEAAVVELNRIRKRCRKLETSTERTEDNDTSGQAPPAKAQRT